MDKQTEAWEIFKSLEIEEFDPRFDSLEEAFAFAMQETWEEGWEDWISPQVAVQGILNCFIANPSWE